VIGCNYKTSARMAALVNGTFGRARLKALRNRKSLVQNRARERTVN
jgi:hypothetical protein